jgi:alkanesulfonate monooxygenase SsuD/methylene tetrahydromethanopterin reductase-like flavin-dependent oxidoreductase (luciferase family)
VSGPRRVPRIRIGVQIDQQHADYDELRDAALRAEDAGVDIVFNLDHFFPYSGDPTGKHFEALTMLASLAEVTERVELGTLVTGIGYRKPNLLADMARTIDHISGGRFILGLGAGWYERDYRQSASSSGRPRSGCILRRDVPVIRARLERLNPAPGQGGNRSGGHCSRHRSAWWTATTAVISSPPGSARRRRTASKPRSFKGCREGLESRFRRTEVAGAVEPLRPTIPSERPEDRHEDAAWL